MPNSLPLLRQAAMAVALARRHAWSSCSNPMLAARQAGFTPWTAKVLPRVAAALGGDADSPFREVLAQVDAGCSMPNALCCGRACGCTIPQGPEALAGMLPQPGSSKGPNPTVPIGFAALLAQGIVAMADDGSPACHPGCGGLAHPMAGQPRSLEPRESNLHP
jgi:hypothetical protein